MTPLAVRSFNTRLTMSRSTDPVGDVEPCQTVPDDTVGTFRVGAVVQ